MFKKVKSLLVASLLVLSMSGNVFAAETDAGTEAGAGTEASTCIIKGGAGKHDNNTHIHTIKKEDRQTQKKINAMIADLEAQVAGKDHLKLVKGENSVKVYRVFNGEDILIEDIQYEVYSEEDQKEQKGWIDIEITPETGDTIALGGLAVAGVAVGALALNNKKKNRK